MLSLHKRTKTIKLQWTADGQPVSDQFGDVYFSKENGLEETRYVFIKQNNLAERFAKMKPDSLFTIGETGFGTGLNFLAVWAFFNQFAHKAARLHFISAEKYPLSYADIKKASLLWSELNNYTEALIKQYPKVHTQGYHHLSFDGGRVMLTLIFDDATSAFSSLNGYADAWFLDGFSPKCNPDLWTQPLFNAISNHSHNATTCATFTASGAVKNGLTKAGFTVTKIKGFGKKRHMLHGYYNPVTVQNKPTNCLNKKPKKWLVRHQEKVINNKQAIVVGAGLAGCSTAYALVRRGWKVTIVDKSSNIAGGASGNLQGALYLRLSGTDTLLSKLLVQCYMYSLTLIESLLHHERSRSWEIPGLVQSCFDEQEAKRQFKILSREYPEAFVRAASEDELSRLAGIAADKRGLLFGQGGWVRPPALCCALTAHENIVFKEKHTVSSLTAGIDCWQVQCAEGHLLSAPVVVLANSHAVNSLLPKHNFPLRKIRGQVSYLPETKSSSRLNQVVCGKNYIMPAIGGLHTTGATHQFHDDDTSVRISDHAENLYNLKKQFPAIYHALSCETLELTELLGRTGFRCSAPDYLPIAGPVADAYLFKRQFAGLSKNAKAEFNDLPTYLSGLYINVAHGSRGLITCPLAGELVAAYIENEVLPVSTEVMEGLHPNRFLARSLIHANNSVSG